MYTLSLLVAIFLACFAFSTNGSRHISMMSFDDGNFNVTWEHNRTTDELEFGVNVRTTGWVGFGFTFTPKDMANYDVVVGGRTGAGQNYFNSFYTTGLMKPLRDTEQSYTLDSAEEQNGITSLRFRRPRETNDTRDVQFNVTTRVFLVWAYHNVEDGPTPVTFRKHTHRNHTTQALQVVFPPMQVNMTSSPEPTASQAPGTRRPTRSSGIELGVSVFTISVSAILSILSR